MRMPRNGNKIPGASLLWPRGMGDRPHASSPTPASPFSSSLPFPSISLSFTGDPKTSVADPKTSLPILPHCSPSHFLCIKEHSFFSVTFSLHLDLCLHIFFVLLEFSLKLRTFLPNFPPTYFAKKATPKKDYFGITSILK